MYWTAHTPYSMEHSPSREANRSSASQEITRILWNLEPHCPIYKCPPPVPILSRLDPVHTPTSHFLKIHLNITYPSRSWSPKWSLTLRIPHRNPVYASPLSHTCNMPRPCHSSRFYHPNNIGWGAQLNSTLHLVLRPAIRKKLRMKIFMVKVQWSTLSHYIPFLYSLRNDNLRRKGKVVSVRAIKACRVRKLRLHSFLTSDLDWSWRSTSRSSRFIPG